MKQSNVYRNHNTQALQAFLFLNTTAEVGGAVEVAVGDGFHDVVVEDVGAGLEVGDGAGDF